MSGLRRPRVTELFSERPGLSLALAVAFGIGAVLFAVGWLPRAAPHEVGRGEYIVMAASCTVIAVYFTACARRGFARSSRER